MFVRILGKKKKKKKQNTQRKKDELYAYGSSHDHLHVVSIHSMKFLFYFQIFSLHLISIGSIGAQRFCTLIALRVCGIDAHIYAFIILSKKREKNKTISSLCLNGKKKTEKKHTSVHFI
jgi:hypothetical protein